MKVIYQGSLQEGEVLAPDGKRFPFKRGEAVELPGEVAADLLATSDWEQSEIKAAVKGKK